MTLLSAWKLEICMNVLQTGGETVLGILGAVDVISQMEQWNSSVRFEACPTESWDSKLGNTKNMK